jgi:predicted lipoprotein with Yx(FWY)xxD motif
MKKIILSAVILTLINACAGVGGGTKALAPISLTNEETIAGQNSVLIGDFRVTFITFDKTSATANQCSVMIPATRLAVCEQRSKVHPTA